MSQNPRYSLNFGLRLSARQPVGIIFLMFVQKFFKVISKSHIRAITLAIEVSYILTRSYAPCLYVVVKLK